MGSGIYFPISALFFSILTIGLFYAKRSVNSFETKIYEKLMLLNFLGLIIELLCTFASYISGQFPQISDIILKSYLVYNLLWTFILFCYVFYISVKEDFVLKNKNKLLIIGTMILAFFISLIYSLRCDLVILNNFNVRYTEGPSVNLTYLICGILIFGMVVLMLRNLKHIKNKKYIPIFIFIIAIVIGIVIQKNVPGLLIMTYVETLTVSIMFHTIENPDMKLLEEVHKSKEISDNANEEKSVFLYNITQEIRNSTNLVDDYVNLILMSEDIDEIKDTARTIKAATARFHTTTNEIFDVSRIDSALVKVYNNKYSIKLLIKELVNIYEKKCISKGLEFRTNIEHNIPDMLYGDSINLKEVLMCLLDNSVKYTSSGYVELNINTIIKNNICRLVITVEDSGVGIKSEDINNIKMNDSALGKANKLITLINGTMVISSNYGIGTKVKVILDQNIEDVSSEMVKKYDKVFDNTKIMVVDDSEPGLKVVEKLLKDSNIVLDKVSKGKDCLNKIRSHEKYDLLLIDESVSEVSGEYILKKLQEIRNFDIPVILLTKDNKYEYDDKYKDLGFSDFILKPIKKEEILKKIELNIKKKV